MVTVLAFLIVFTAVVIVHEFGHFIAARKCGIKAYEFSIGFPFSPKILTFFRHKETEFTLRLLPFGGFVGFSNEGEEESPEFLSAPRWKRAVIASAGSLFNIAFALIAITAAFMLGKHPYLPDVFMSALKSMYMVFAGTFGLLTSLFSGTASMDSLSGPIGIAVLAGKAAHAGVSSLIYFTGILSLSLGILNLLPLPALDGGHILILMVEALKRKTLSESAYKIIGVAGYAFLILITVAASYRDIVKFIA